MNFDMVFDIQHAYRQVVHAFAYPGEIVSLKQEADRLEAGLPCRAATGVLLYMLLDADTSFHAVEEEQLTDSIARLDLLSKLFAGNRSTCHCDREA